MDRTTGTPLGAVLLVLLALGFGWALLGRHDGLALSSFGTSSTSDSDFAAAQAQPALVWPQDMPEPMTNYVGRRVQAFGLQVMTVDADEGFWVSKDGRTAWVQLQTYDREPLHGEAGRRGQPQRDGPAARRAVPVADLLLPRPAGERDRGWPRCRPTSPSGWTR